MHGSIQVKYKHNIMIVSGGGTNLKYEPGAHFSAFFEILVFWPTTPYWY